MRKRPSRSSYRRRFTILKKFVLSKQFLKIYRDVRHFNSMGQLDSRLFLTIKDAIEGVRVQL